MTPTFIKPLIIFILVTFFSCEEKAVYHDFSEVAKEFLWYEPGYHFMLREEGSGDTLHFRVTEIIRKEVEYRELDNLKMLPENDYYPYARVNIIQGEACDAGITVRGFPQEDLFLAVDLENCLSVTNFYSPEFIGDFTVGGHSFTDVYRLKNPWEELFYSVTSGILSIDNLATGKILYQRVLEDTQTGGAEPVSTMAGL